MSLPRVWLIVVTVALAFCGVPDAQAQVRTVEVVGQAAETGLGKTVTRRRALEDALTQAAIQGGADIHGYTAISEGVLVSDQLVLRPSSHILDYTVLSETTQNRFYKIKIRAVVGELPPPQQCGRRAQLDLALYPMELHVGPQTPAWMAHLQPELSDAFKAALSARPEVTLAQATAGNDMPGRSAQVGYDMDYAALTQGVRASAPKAAGTLGYKAKVTLDMIADRVLRMTVTSRLVDRASTKTVAQDRFQQDIRVGTRLPFRAIKVLAAPDRRKIALKLTQGISEHLAGLIENYACRPLSGKLHYAGGILTLPFGKMEGLTKLHLAYSEGRDTPYVLFHIVRLDTHSVQLAPLDRRRNLKAMAGMNVRFMEMAK